MASPATDDYVRFDGLVFKGDGWTPALDTSRLAAFHVTAADFLVDFDTTRDGVSTWLEVLNDQSDKLFPLLSAEDLQEVGRSDRVGVVLGLQNGMPVEDSVDRVEFFWQMGVRILQLTYNEGNRIADGCLEKRNAGLSPLGREVVQECNRSGMLLDISHVGMRSSLETVEASAVPVAATHTNRATLAHSPRNKDDEVLRAITARGGVVGVSPYGPMCWTGDGRPTYRTFVEQVLSVVELVGAESVAIGTDLSILADPSGIADVLSRSVDRYPEIFAAYTAAFGQSLSSRYCVGFEDISVWSDLPASLEAAGLSKTEVAGIVGGNWLRLFGQVWSTRER